MNSKDGLNASGTGNIPKFSNDHLIIQNLNNNGSKLAIMGHTQLSESKS